MGAKIESSGVSVLGGEGLPRNRVLKSEQDEIKRSKGRVRSSEIY